MSTLTSDVAAWFDRAAVFLPLLSFPMLLLAVLAWWRLPDLRRVAASDSFVRIAVVVGSVSMLLYLGQIAVYLVYAGYLDHVQATVAAMSFLAVHGYNVYSPPDTAVIYGKPFGPALYFVDGLGILGDPSVFGSKLPGVVALVAALGATWRALRWKLADRRAALLALSTFVLLLLPYGLFAYWNRPEPFLLLCASFSLAALRLPRVWAEIAIGLLMGVAVGFKLHGFLYELPAAFAVIGRGIELRDRARSFLLLAGSALAPALAPFAMPNVSLESYRYYLSLATGVGMDPLLLRLSIGMAAAIAGPPLLLYACRPPVLVSTDRWLIFGLVTAVAGLVLVAGRVGAGPYHLIPLIPVCLYATAIVGDPASVPAYPLARPNLWAAGVFLALIAGCAGFLRNYGGLSVVEFLHDRYAMSEAIAELEELGKEYPGAQMAASDNDAYWLSMQGAVLVMQSGQLSIDFGTWMDLVLAGADTGRLMPYIDRCHVPVWVMPKTGAPFSLSSIYTNGPLFSDAFRQRFLEDYAVIKTGRFYRVWTCRRG